MAEINALRIWEHLADECEKAKDYYRFEFFT